MRASSPRDRVLLGALLLLLACRLALACLVVPPWQHPDEPQHFEYVATLVKVGGLRPLTAIDPEVSRAVVESMVRHGWWAYYGRRLPSPLPSSVGAVGLATAIGTPRGYYVSAALLLRLLGLDGLPAQYWALRVVSALLGLVTAVGVWSGARVAFGRPVAHGTLALLAVHPQFGLVSTAVNPDALVNLCGAVVWWQGARALAGEGRLRGTTLAVLAALVATLTKRVGLPLLGAAGAIAAASLWPAWRESAARRRRAIGLLVAGLALGALTAALLIPDTWLVVSHSRQLLPGPGPAFAPGASWLDFSRNLFFSAWLNAGWLTLPAPTAWYWAALGVSALPLVAVLRLLAPRVARRERAMLALALAMVAIQALAIYATYFRAGDAAQGRYLFPAIGPFLALVWIGATWWPPGRGGRVAAGFLLSVVVLLDVYAWFGVLVPGFGR